MTASELKPGQRFRLACNPNERMVYIALDRGRLCGWLDADILEDLEQTIIPHGRFRYMAAGDCLAVHAESWVLAGLRGDEDVVLTEGN